MNGVVGVLACPLHEGPRRSAGRRGLRRAYRRTLEWKANPRPPDYMRALFAERHPEGVVASAVPADAREIILLYPDAIGLGFRRLERSLPRGVPVRVLNGRGREFVLDRRGRRALTLRRALERTLIVEGLALAALALATPPLLLFDLARGRT